MAARFNFSAPGRRGPGDPWFRIGAFDVTTTILVLAIEIVGLILYAVNRSALRHLFLYSSDFRHGQIWRAPSIVNPLLSAYRARSSQCRACRSP